MPSAVTSKVIHTDSESINRVIQSLAPSTRFGVGVINSQSQHVAAPKPLEMLSAWLESSEDRKTTLYLWAEAFIRCGSCKRSWDAWLMENPATEPLAGWIEQATAEIRKNGWV